MLLIDRDVLVRHAIIGSALPLLAAALSDLLKGNGFTVDPPFHEGGSVLAAMLKRAPDLAIFDFNGMTPGGVELLRNARGAGLPTRIILFCNEGDSDVPIEAVELAVDGLLQRNAPLEMVQQCIVTVADGEQWLDPRAMKTAYDRMAQRQAATPSLLTRRERDVARLVAAGQRNRVIAGTLGISEGTVKMHLHNVYAKLGLESRTQLAMDMRLREYA